MKRDTSLEECFDKTFPEENLALKDEAPLIFSTSSLRQSFSPAETTSRHLGFLSILASRPCAVGSWFEPLEKKPDQFSPQNYIWTPCSVSIGQMTFNFTRGHVTPLAMLMCSFSPAKPRVDVADKLSITMMSVNKSSAILSRREIEKVTWLYESFFVQVEQCLWFKQKVYPLFLFGNLQVNRVQVCNWYGHFA